MTNANRSTPPGRSSSKPAKPTKTSKSHFYLMTNWKMHGLTGEVVDFIERLNAYIAPIVRNETNAAVRGGSSLPTRPGAASGDMGGYPLHIVICPPFTALDRAHEFLDENKVPPGLISLGAQACGHCDEGAYTGAISPPMLRDVGARYVILGHSERRRIHKETGAELRIKAELAPKSGLTPIVCIGETLAERDNGQTEETLSRQIEESLPRGFRGFVSYEPIWTVGASKPPCPEALLKTATFIKTALERDFGFKSPPSLLYGGSVNSGNIADIFPLAPLDGVLIGRAGRDIDDFREMWRITRSLLSAASWR